MGIFSEYGKKADSIVKAAMKNYIDARNKAEIATAIYERDADPYADPSKTNLEQQAKAARSKAAMLDAQKALKDAQQFMLKEIDSVSAVGKELQAAVNERFCADGGQVDIGTLELLKSGILKAKEFFSLYEKAAKDGNHTMMRLIGKYAGDAAVKAPTKELETQLRTLAINSQRETMGNQYIDCFNAYLDAYGRAANNPALVDRWEELTAGTLENL